MNGLKYFRVTSGSIAGVPVDISRTGYTGDLGFEIWMPWHLATRVWDALVAAGARFDLRPAGMLALDVARIEAGLLLIEVDFFSSRKALIAAQQYSPFEMGLGRLVQLDKAHVRRAVGLAERARARRRPADCRFDHQLGRSGGALREAPAAAAGARDRIASGGAGLPRRSAGRQSDVDHVVSGAEENDCAGDCREGIERG